MFSRTVHGGGEDFCATFFPWSIRQKIDFSATSFFFTFLPPPPPIKWSVSVVYSIFVCPCCRYVFLCSCTSLVDVVVLSGSCSCISVPALLAPISSVLLFLVLLSTVLGVTSSFGLSLLRRKEKRKFKSQPVD